MCFVLLVGAPQAAYGPFSGVARVANVLLSLTAALNASESI